MSSGIAAGGKVAASESVVFQAVGNGPRIAPLSIIPIPAIGAMLASACRHEDSHDD